MRKSKLIVDILKKEDEKKYSEFVENNADSTIYHTIEWKKIIEKQFNYEPYYLILKDENEEISAVLPLFFVNNIYGKRLESITHSAYGGAIGDENNINSLFKKVTEISKKLNCNALMIRDATHKKNSVYKDINTKNYEKWNRQVVEISDIETMWKKQKKTNRTNIRKAMKNDIHIKKCDNKKDLIKFSDLFQKTYHRLGFPVYPHDFFLDLWDIMHPKGYIEVFLAQHNGITVSSTLNFPFNDTVYSAYAGWDDSKKLLNANTLLDWHTIKWCSLNNYKYFDFGLTPFDNKGLFKYKSDFNTTNIPFGYYFYPDGSHMYNNLSFSIKFGRKIMKKIPLSLNKKIGFFIYKNLL